MNDAKAHRFLEQEHGIVLDAFQRDAIAAVRAGRNVLVSAPTSSGKTLVAEAAVSEALAGGGRAFYTTPIKALSNQKFHDLCAVFGDDRIGLSTGDNSIRPDAPVVVATTEVLRNMIYASGSAQLAELAWVVLDEVHYLSDPYRGAVWEEVILGAPPSARFVCLSATLSNADAFGGWLTDQRGPTDVIVHTERPVELHSLHMIHDDHEGELVVFQPTKDNGKASPKWNWIDRNRSTVDWDDYDEDWEDYDNFARRQPSSWRFSPPPHAQAVKYLREHSMLPAIFFVFSRDRCDSAAAQLAGSAKVATADSAAAIERIARKRLESLSDEERAHVDADGWLRQIKSGVAAHHAGLMPVFKEIVEECFIAGHIKVVFATETLALGMNMPARTTVIENLSKFNGTTHEILRPIEYTQIAGRAGRRGIDEIGHCVTLWSPHVSETDVVPLINSKSFPLSSTFAPNYNMAANLAGRCTRSEAADLMRRSFAEFLAHAGDVAQERKIAELEAERDALKAGVPPDDLDGYMALDRTYREAQSANSKARAATGLGDAVIRGRIIWHSSIPGNLGVITNVKGGGQRASVRTVARDGTAHKFSLDSGSLTAEYRACRTGERVQLPSVSADHPDMRAAVAEALSAVDKDPETRLPGVGDRENAVHQARAARDSHPAAAAPDLDRWLKAPKQTKKLSHHIARLQRELAAKRKAARGPADALGPIIEILSGLDYLNIDDDEWSVTDLGTMLAAVHHERDLLITETLRRGMLDELDDPSLAAVASVLAYDHRSKLPATAVALNAAAEKAVNEIGAAERSLRTREAAHHIKLTSLGDEPAGFCSHAYAWAGGATLQQAVGRMPLGDFVRNAKLTADVLRTVAKVSPDKELNRQARRVVEVLVRGVVSSDAASRAEQGSAGGGAHPAVVDPDALAAAVKAIANPREAPAHARRRRSSRHHWDPDKAREAFVANPAQPKTHYSVSSLKHRGWTDAMVRDLLGDPDKRSVNPHYRKAAQTRLYAIERVHETEATEAFAERLAKAEKRRAARAK